MPLTFPWDHVLNRSTRLYDEIRVTRQLRDQHFVHVQILEAELHDLANRTPPYRYNEQYIQELNSETQSLSRLYEIAKALYHWHEMHVRHCREEREHLQDCIHNRELRRGMYSE